MREKTNISLGNREVGERKFLFAAGAVAAVVFGILYDALVSHWSELDDEPFWESVRVTIGVAVTLLLSLTVVPLKWIKKVLLFFTLTGIPMIVGAKRRQDRRRSYWQRAMGNE